MIKKLSFLLIFGLVTSFGLQAQKIAVVDINGILENMADYKAAQAELDNIASVWRQEIAQEYDKIKSMYNKYQAEQVLLSDEVRKQREEEIMNKEKEVRELQKRRFGPEGDLFGKRQELVRPIQENVFAAIESYATDRGYDLILDKAGSAGILFTSDELDKTEDIKKRLKL
jgi:outer membrane protein